LSSQPAILSQKNSLHFDISAKELAVMGLFRQKKLLENYSNQDYEMVNAIFEELNIAPLLNASVLTLSGGEQQLVWMAQLLLQNKAILLLDEPTQYLDVKNKKRFFALATKLVKEQQKTIICVTHDLLNLYSMEGYILNLSEQNPSLEILSAKSLDKHLAFLEN
jgi:iron complex transport system ATP-binding protein